MAKFKIGDKVRIVDVRSIMFGGRYFNNGDITEVVGYFEGNKNHPELKATKGGPNVESMFILESEYHAVEKVMTKEEAGHSALLSRILALELRVAELEGEEAGKSPEEISNPFPWLDGKVEYESAKTPKSPNERRKEAIEKAKEFVKDTQKKATSHRVNYKGNVAYRIKRTVSEFVINEDKRTVVALVKGADDPILLEKGIAKCAPDDVFNEHIGKAIALGRAYGLDTTDFEMAPQPTEVVDGHIVTFSESDSWHRKVEYRVDGIGKRAKNLVVVKDVITETHSLGERAFGGDFSNLTIISDTEAKYE